MDVIFQQQVLGALQKGDVAGAGLWIAVFVVIWLELRGLKNEMKKMNGMVSIGFEAGEKRFAALEKNDQNFEHRLTEIETIIKQPKGGEIL